MLKSKMAKDKKRARRKKNKDPNKPKRPMSSFMFFANEKRPELRAKFPDMKITDIGKKLGELWKDVTADDKTRFEGMHTKDLARYNKQMETYTPPAESESSSDSDSDKPKKKKKKKNDPNRPKRGMSSFMFFANAKRTEVRAAHPDMKITDIGKKLSEMWKVISSEEKKKYEDKQAQDKERYKKQMETYTPPKEEEKEKEKSSKKKKESRKKKEEKKATPPPAESSESSSSSDSSD